MNLLKPASEYNAEKVKNFSLLLLGQPKQGKTSLSLAFPGPLAVLDIDRNLNGPLNRMSPRPEFFYCCPDIDEKTSQPYPPELKYKSWQTSMEFMKQATASPQIKTIIIDGLATLANYLQDFIIHSAGSEAQKLKVAGQPVMQQTFWTPFRNNMANFIYAARASGKLIVMTCHEQIVTDDNGANLGYRPLISGQLRENLAGFFSDVWRCETQLIGNNAKYLIRFSPKNLMQIGNSLGIKEPQLDVTDLSPNQIWQKLSPYFA